MESQERIALSADSPNYPAGWEDTWKMPDLERQLQNLETPRNVTFFQMETEDGKNDDRGPMVCRGE